MRYVKLLILVCLILVLFTGMLACDSDSETVAADPAPTQVVVPTETVEPVESVEPPVIEETFVSDVMAGEMAPWTSTEFADDSDDFQFAIVSDRCGIHRPGVFDGAMDQLNLLQPEFVMSVGDLIEGYTEDAATLNDMRQEVDAMINKLEMPFFRVVGNHDMGNDFMRQDWLDRYGKDYYHFKYKDVLFLCLNTEDPPTPLSEELLDQIQWITDLLKEDPEAAMALVDSYYKGEVEGYEEQEELEEVEAANISDTQVEYFLTAIKQNDDVRWTFLFMHKPAWRDVYNCPNFTRIAEALGNSPYSIFAGHEHHYQYEEINGTDHIILSATGGLTKGTGPAYMDHVTWITMTDNGPEICNLKLEGILDKAFETENQ